MTMLWHLPIFTNNMIHRSTEASQKNNEIKSLSMLVSLEKNDDVFYMY